MLTAAVPWNFLNESFPVLLCSGGIRVCVVLRGKKTQAAAGWRIVCVVVEDALKLLLWYSRTFCHELEPRENICNSIIHNVCVFSTWIIYTSTVVITRRREWRNCKKNIHLLMLNDRISTQQPASIAFKNHQLYSTLNRKIYCDSHHKNDPTDTTMMRWSS